MTLEQYCQKHVIGLTGGIASGKSTVAQMLKDLGAIVCDADQLAREVVRPGQPALTAIADTFGQSYLTGTGELDRKALGQLVFQDEAARAQLNTIMHPAIANAFTLWLEDEVVDLSPPPKQPIFYEAALLIETGRKGGFSQLWLVSCAESTQIKRLMARDNLSEELARQRVKTQMPLSEKISQADLVISTDTTKAETLAQVKKALESVQSSQND